MTDTASPRPLHGFNVLLLAEDDRGVCFLAYGCAARDAEEAAKLVEGAALAEGFWEIEVEEVWTPEGGDVEDLGTVPEVFGRLEPTYIDEDLDEGADPGADEEPDDSRDKD